MSGKVSPPERTEIPVADPSVELPPHKHSLSMQLAMILAIVVPLCGVIAAPFFVWGGGFIGLTLVFCWECTSLPYWASRSVFIVFLWAILGSMAVQGPLFRWVARHRSHHQHADTPEDPHSPHYRGGGFRGVLKGFWHAHIGWLFDPDRPGLDRYIKDLTNSGTLRVASRLFPLWVALGLVIPAVLGGLITQNWIGVWTGFIWGGLVRTFLVHHVTWSVNSACHPWGLRPYQSDDESRNNPLFGILALGEGWHNTHPAFPTSARHGLRWWQIDVSYWVIRMMELLGLAWNLKLPTLEAQGKGRRAS